MLLNMSIFAFICDIFYTNEHPTAVKASILFYFESNGQGAVIAGEAI